MMARIFPELFVSHRVQSVNGYPGKLLESLRAAAPRARSDPTVVVLTPGVYNSAFFEHSFLARQMGVELVEGRDLVCKAGHVYMRTSSGEERVDVIYRRVDDEFLDPLHFRADSVVGCPGILNAARAGNVTIANAVGNGVADDKLTYTYMPDIIRYYLDEEPILPNVPTYRLEEPEQLEYALVHLDELVLKPVGGSGGQGTLCGGCRTEVLDRAGDRRTVDRPDANRRQARTPPSGPASFRDQRRQSDLGASGRSHPCRTPRGKPGGQLESGWRVEGHVGHDPLLRREGGIAGTGAGLRSPNRQAVLRRATGRAVCVEAAAGHRSDLERP
jgi:hypothetical protein